MPVAVFRRYTPPTCTLELRGERSPLSVWSDRPIVKQVQFMLSLDGPQRPQEQRVTLKGGRAQLDHLHGVVDAYVQHTLGLSAQTFQTTVLQPSTPQQSSAATLNASPAATGQALASPGRIDDLGWAKSSSPDITLMPKGVLKHELQLGPLAPHPSVSSVVLNTTELFDLAHALDSYHGEVDSIPELNPVQRRSSVSPWMKGAAVAVLAIGVTATLASVLQSPMLNASFKTATGESANSVDDIAEEQLAQRSAPTDSLRIELEDIPTANEALPPAENREDAETPAPEANTSADEESDAASAESDADENAQSKQETKQDVAIARLPATDRLPRPARSADTAEQDPSNSIASGDRLESAQATLPQPSPQSNSTATGAIGAAPPNATLRTPVAPTPLPAEIAAAGTRPGAPSANAPSANINNGISAGTPDIGAIELDSAVLPPELTAIPPIPSIESGFDPLANDIESSRSSAPPAPSSQSAPSGRQSGVAQRDDKGPQEHNVSAETQLAEVQSYFESEWQPPDALNQALQYRLVFNGDGSLQQAIPLGESARTYRSNVNLPATGKPFVSSFSGNDTPPMRLVLGANGQVRVFIESLD